MRTCLGCDGECYITTRCCGGWCTDGGLIERECGACLGNGEIEDAIVTVCSPEWWADWWTGANALDASLKEAR